MTIGIRTWWTRLTQALRPGSRPGEGQSAPDRTRAEQNTDREERRQGGMSTEDRAWEQASQQRNRDQQAGVPKPTDPPDA